MSAEYPNPCCRCGLCCLAETCPIGQIAHRITKQDRCPSLHFDGSQASCALAEKLVPIGDGCCIKARAYKDGIEYNFADLPDHLKIQVVSDMRRKHAP